MNTLLTVLALLGLLAGLGAAVLLLALLHRVLKPLLESKRYADDILAAGLGIARNLDGADELVRTRDLLRDLGVT